MAASAAGRLPGGQKVGDAVYFVGSSQTWPSGNKVVYGLRGQVAGAAAFDEVDRVAVLFHGNKGAINCYVTQLSPQEPGALPGGHKVGDAVYYVGSSHTWPNGDRLVYGERGQVTGASTTDKDKKVAVRFPGNKGAVNCFLHCLSPQEPGALPGGHKVGDMVYFVGSTRDLSNGERLVYGERGQVSGGSTTDKDIRVAVRFPENKAAVDCLLKNLSPQEPGAAAAPAVTPTPGAAAAGGAAGPGGAAATPPGPPAPGAVGAGGIDPTVFAASNYLAIYDTTDIPGDVASVFRAKDAVIAAIAGVMDEERKALDKLLDKVLTGRFNRAKEVAAWMWTLPEGRCTLAGKEFCSHLNHFVRTDDASLLGHAMPLIRALNSNLVTRFAADPGPRRWPPNDRTFRGIGIPEEKLNFFTAGRNYRVGMYLATSFLLEMAMDFAQQNRSAEKVPAIFTVHVDGINGCLHVNYLEHITDVRGEKEFLFPPYSAFTVVEPPTLRAGVWHIGIAAASDNQDFPNDLPTCLWH